MKLLKSEKKNPRMKKIRVIQNKISTPFEIAGLS
jgi:hypothetical protein